MGTTQDLAKYVVEAKFEDFPSEAVERTKELFIDLIGASLGGTTTRLGKTVTEYVREMGAAPEAGVIGCGFKTTAGNAAWSNTALGHVLELESMGARGALNPTPLLAVALAVGEKMGAEGKEVIGSYILEQELQARTSIASLAGSGKRFDPFKFMFFGCAAGAGKLMKLDTDQMATAFGLAASQAGGGLSINSGTAAHTLDFGTSTRSGIEAAILAKRGVTARKDVIEAPKGFGDTFVGPGDYNLELMTKDLGKDLHVLRTSTKKYPCCWFNHAPLDLLFDMMQEHNFSYEDVESLEAHINVFIATWLQYPEPQTEDNARFSLQHVLGTAILKGEVWLDSFTPEAITDPKYIESRRKVKVTVHPEWPSGREAERVVLDIKLKDGRQLSGETGKVREPTRDDITNQYRRLAQPFLPGEQVERSLDMLINLEKVPNVAELMKIVTL